MLFCRYDAGRERVYYQLYKHSGFYYIRCCDWFSPGVFSTDGTWGDHMQFTSDAIGEIGKINGPRCCKRDAMIAFKNGIEYVNSHYGVILEYEQMKCEFSAVNMQCIKDRCPFY